MADIFISYKREERQAVEHLAATLRGLGLSVWFDASMSAGETFSDEIDREARSAKTILVCWSPSARDSRWVKAEALIGFERDVLAAAYVAGPDGFSAPTPFNTIHAEDLRAWLNAPSDAHSGWRSLIRRIGKLCERPDIESWGALDAQASGSDLRAWIGLHGASPLFLTVDTMLRDRETQEIERAALEKAARERRAREEDERQRQEEARKQQEAALLRTQQAEEDNRVAEAEKQRSTTARRKRTMRTRWVVGLVLVVTAPVIWGVWGWSIDRAARSFWADATTPPYTASSPILAAPADARNLSDGATFRDCLGCPEMVVIPAGSFLMGSPPTEVRSQRPTPTGNEYQYRGEEEPQHQVSITRFAAGMFEVTFDDWRTCVEGGGCWSKRNPPDPFGYGRRRRPIVDLTWNEMQEYVEWLSSRTDETYRLLSEAEWEYAARGGTTTAFSWGDSIRPEQAHYNWRIPYRGGPIRAEGPVGPAAVGAYPPNPFGLYDMHGNFREFTQDCWNANYVGAPTDGSARTEGNCPERATRGGLYMEGPHRIRSAARYASDPEQTNLAGFRVARTL